MPSPGVDAEELAAHLLGVPRTRLGLTPLVESDLGDRYQALVAQRADRIPLQHLIGRCSSAAHAAVGPGCSSRDRRPSRWSMGARGDRRTSSDPVVVDLCAGSGAIALGHLGGPAGCQGDRRRAAPGRAGLGQAEHRKHIDAGGDAGRAARRGHLRPAVTGRPGRTADLVTANPPYVPDGTPVEPEVADHDPAEAVFAGPDGLAVIKPLISVAAGLLKVGGVLAIEHDDTQGETVPALLAGRRVLADVVDHA